MSGPRRRDTARPRRSLTTPRAQASWRRVVNRYAPFELLSADEVEAIHQTSLRVLQELGIEVLSPAARALFKSAGAEVDEATSLVRMPPELVLSLVARAPAAFRLVPRNHLRQLVIGGRHVAFGLVAGPPNVHDRIRGRRAGNYADYCDFVRLAHHFNAIHLLGNQVCAPVELPANSRHLDTYLANLVYSDLAFHCSAIGAGRVEDAVRMAALAQSTTVEVLATRPAVMTVININSPRRLDEAMAEGLMAMARHGQPVVVTPFTLMGAMAPVTLAAALAQQNAEALFGIALAQLVRPGTPVMYGAFTSNVDLRSGAPAFGTPEHTQANIASGQLARRYRLPYRCSNASASNAADAQGAQETQLALWGALLGHANLVYHAAGWQEGGLTASFEKLVLDVEMLEAMIAFLEPVTVDAATLAFDAISRVPPGGHHFGDAHTLARYEHAFHSPRLADWRPYEAWREAGAEDATVRATGVWQRALGEYEMPPLDVSAREALEDYVARRRIEIGSGDP